MHSTSLLSSMATLAALLSTAALVSAHGYLSSPPPRGIEKVGYNIDSLKSPNHNGICRGETKPGQITPVKAGQTLRLGLTITAPHVGPCKLSMLDLDLGNEVPVASKMDCAAPGNPGFWNVQLPTGVTGRKVLRWQWEGRHVTPGEPYEQCIDVNFNGQEYSGGAGDSAPQKPGRRAAGAKRASGRVRAMNYVGDKADASEEQSYDGESEQPQGEQYDGAKGQDDSRYTAPSPADDSAPASYDDSASYNDDSASYDDGAENYADDAASAPTYGQTDAADDYSGDAPEADYAGEGDSASGGCPHGGMRCSGAGFDQCAHSVWVPMQCPTGTVCKPVGATIRCDWP